MYGKRLRHVGWDMVKTLNNSGAGGEYASGLNVASDLK